MLATIATLHPFTTGCNLTESSAFDLWVFALKIWEDIMAEKKNFGARRFTGPAVAGDTVRFQVRWLPLTVDGKALCAGQFIRGGRKLLAVVAQIIPALKIPAPRTYIRSEPVAKVHKTCKNAERQCGRISGRLAASAGRRTDHHTSIHGARGLNRNRTLSARSMPNSRLCSGNAQNCSETL